MLTVNVTGHVGVGYCANIKHKHLEVPHGNAMHIALRPTPCYYYCKHSYMYQGAVRIAGWLCTRCTTTTFIASVTPEVGPTLATPTSIKIKPCSCNASCTCMRWMARAELRKNSPSQPSTCFHANTASLTTYCMLITYCNCSVLLPLFRHAASPKHFAQGLHLAFMNIAAASMKPPC